MYAIMTGANGNTRILYEYICDNETDIESIPTDKAPAKATCIESGGVFYLAAAGGNFKFAGNATAAKAATPVASIAAGAIALPQNVTLSCSTPTAVIHYTTNGDTPTSESDVYTEAIAVESALTIKALTIATGYSNSDVMSTAYTQAQAATPVPSVEAGAITMPQNVTLTCATSGATMYYTTNGDDPTTESTEYTEAIEIATALTLKAIAVVTGYVNSEIMSAAYTQAVSATPTISPAAGAKVLPFDVTLACATAGAEIYYTVDGSTPDDTKTLYEAPFAVESALTVKAIAITEGYANSEVASAIYTQSVVETPVADPAAGDVAADTEITLTCATVGAAIYYTVDGSAPDATKTLYSAESKPVISGALTLKAIGILTGYANSSVLEAAYTIV